MKIARDGVELAFDDLGTGETNVILIHGWGANRTSLARQWSALSAEHRVLAIDLRGFGESSAPVQAYTIESYSDDVLFVAERAGLQSFAVVGHSMGGLIALDIAGRCPERVTATVVLEAAIAADESVRSGQRMILERLRTEPDFAVRFFAHLLGPRFDPTLREASMAAVTSCRQDVLVSAFEGMLAFDTRAAAERVRCPLLYIGTETPYADVHELRRLCPQVVIDSVGGCGHHFPIEAADEVNAKVARFLARILESP